MQSVFQIGSDASRPVATLVILLLITSMAAGQAPGTIYTYNMSAATFDERVTMATLMGNVNKTSPEMYMAFQTSTATSNPKFWLDQYLLTQPSTNVQWSSSPASFMGLFKNRVNGYIRYDTPDELNVATSLAGVLGGVAVSGATESYATTVGLPMIADARGKDTAWAISNYGSQFNKDKIVSLDPTLHAHELRDYATLHNALVYWEPAGKDAILAGQNDHTQVYGWDSGVGAAGETEFFSSASRHNLKAVAANFSQGYSALSQWEVTVPDQATHVSPDIAAVDGKHYVAFVMSDGDNAQWLTNGFANDARWFGSEFRGNFSMNWDLTPEMLELAPISVKYLYEQAATGENKDFFVTAHGPGTDYPSQVPDYAGSLAATTASMRTVDHNVLSILDNLVGGTWDTGKLDIILDDPTVLGGMYKTNNAGAYDGLGGQIYWHNGKPMVSVKHSLWDGTPQGSASEIAAALNAQPRSPFTNEQSFSVVNIHPWSYTVGQPETYPMKRLNDLVNALDADVEVVTLEELMIHLRNNFGSPVAPGGPTELVANGDFETGTAGWNESGNPFETTYPDDASGGTQSVGFDTEGLADINNPSTWADWRSDGFQVEPGDHLRWSFQFKLTSDSVGEVLAELRGFDSGTTFVEADAIALGQADGQWHQVVRDFVVPASVTLMDLRFNNIFTNVLEPFRGGFRLDEVSVLSFDTVLAGDYNRDGEVTAADFGLWKSTFGSVLDLSADGNGDGVVDIADYVVWRDNFDGSAGLQVATANVPEPSSVLLLLVFLVTTQKWCAVEALRTTNWARR